MTDKNLNITFQPKPTHRNFKDLEGRQFTFLTVIGYLGNRKWYCKCNCGKFAIRTHRTLLGNYTRSCGCDSKRYEIKHEKRGSRPESKVNNPTYRAYKAAKNRCTNPNNAAYKWYGGRGIEFRFNSFNELVEDIGERPDASLSLDRINNDGHYEKGNIRWATREQQIKNKRPRWGLQNRPTIKELAIQNNIPAPTVYARYHKLGWCFECSFTLPSGSKCSHR